MLKLLIAPALFCSSLAGQQTDSSVRMQKRKTLAWTVDVVGTVGVHAMLYKTWYSDFPSSHFHWINDNHEWLQMDKMGHAWSASMITSNTAEGFHWAGYNWHKSALYGAATALVFQYAIEYFDGRSTAWGASKGDLMANTIGIIYSGVQRYAWGKCRIPFRFTVHHTSYAGIRPELLGHSFAERILKDYNGQTYWIDINPWRMKTGPTWWPKFLGLSLGYGAEGMVGGYNNIWKDKEGNTINRTDIKRYRQFFISPAVTFGYTHSRHKALRVLAWMSEHVRVPMPTLELSNNNHSAFHWLYW